MSSNHYDVIIIGTGAGGGTLACTARAVRQEDPAPRARRLRAAREGELGPARRQRRGALPHHGRPGATRDGKRAPPAHQLLRRRQHQVLRRGAVPPARARTSASCATTAASRRPGRSRYDELEPYYTQAEHLYQVHGERGDDPTEPPAQRAVPASRRSATSRASSSCTTTSRAPASGRSTCRSACCSTRRTRARSPCIRCDTCDGFPCLVQRQGRRAGDLRRAGARAPERDAADRRPRRRGSRPTPSGREVTGGARRARRRARRRYSADIVVVAVRRDQLGGAAAALGERAPPARPRQRLRRRRPPLHGPHQLGAAGALDASRTRPSSRRRSRSTTSTSARRTGRFPMGHISFVGKLDAVTLSRRRAAASRRA